MENIIGDARKTALGKADGSAKILNTMESGPIPCHAREEAPSQQKKANLK